MNSLAIKLTEAEITAEFLAAADELGLDVELSSARQNWDGVVSGLRYVPCAYSLAMIEYQLAYLGSFDRAVINLSVILLHDHKRVGVWPVCLRCRANGEWSLGSNEGDVLPPLLSQNLADSSARKIHKSCFALLRSFETRLPFPLFVEGREEFCDREGVSEWGSIWLRAGAMSQVEYDLFVDLSLPFAEIWSRIRRSYRSLIHTGERLWQVACVREPDEVVWQEFRDLHLAVAGRVTRNAESWRKQLEAIAQNAAFLVTLRNTEGRLVGAGLFHVSRQEGVYAVGAYDRKLFDKPLGHVVQIAAMREMQARGLRWYRIGTRPYPSSQPSPTEKELSIAEFKEGFSTHLMPRLAFDYKQSE